VRLGALLGLVALSLAYAASADADPDAVIQGGYSTKPLERAVFDPARVAVETTVFNNWLNANYASLTSETMKGPREHLYYLIDSWAKMLYLRDHFVLPPTPDGVLQILFSWSERLGVFGGRLVHSAVKSPEFPDAPAVMPVPAGFKLALQNDMLVLSSESGHWSVAVPYYFMLWNIAEFEATGGPRTQLVALSTGAAVHEGQDGHSQATLILLFGPGAAPASVGPYWTKQLGFTGDEPQVELGVRSLKSRQRYDKSENMHHEYTTWGSRHGEFVVAYLGINGTYQWNRPHFLDFLRSIQER
jgi:hypothetical protein